MMADSFAKLVLLPVDKVLEELRAKNTQDPSQLEQDGWDEQLVAVKPEQFVSFVDELKKHAIRPEKKP